MGAELFHADRRTGRHNKAKFAFRNFANAPKNEHKAINEQHMMMMMMMTVILIMLIARGSRDLVEKN